ncbi:hypothetical protein J23TS9_41990 [Paenibacillus sp. J23TS9]|nr:hypothetical protein J23TS9_41990 [Paenibacillus sp. J23TS9]
MKGNPVLKKPLLHEQGLFDSMNNEAPKPLEKKSPAKALTFCPAHSIFVGCTTNTTQVERIPSNAFLTKFST